MPLFPRLAPHSPDSPLNLSTLLSLLNGADDSNPFSYHYTRSQSPLNRREGLNISPNFDVIETAKAYILQGEFPGLTDKKAVGIEFTDPQTLVVRGKIEKLTRPVTPAQEKDSKDQIKYWISERNIGSFQRTFSFPGLIDQDNVKAKLENGLLTIEVPKRAKLPLRKVEIQ
ncbi:HSP20-like chaperone [Kalaharituber pfeilii]|nr:HSP20-like chaperone [Kalaharituber pfeilii]